MSGNRSDELKFRVDELAATVRGLTQELVEANERIRALEAQVEEATEAQANRPLTSDDRNSTDDTDDTTTGDESTDGTRISDDIIVA